MDILSIQNFKLDATIGVFEWEHAIKQQIILDMKLSLVTQICTDRSLAQTIDYKSLTDAITKFVDQTPCELIENLAEHISMFIFKHYTLVEHIELCIKKPYAIAPNVSFTIKRTREAYNV